MKLRAVASIALAAALATGLAGCNLFSPQRTTMQYDASDGVGVSVGELELRNMMIIVDGESEGTPESGILVGAVVNHSGNSSDLTATLDGTSVTIPVPADYGISTIGFGDESENVTFEGVELVAGSTVEVSFSATGADPQIIEVPVLDGTLAEYATLVPTATPTPTAPAAPVATPGETTDEEAPADEAPTS